MKQVRIVQAVLLLAVAAVMASCSSGRRSTYGEPYPPRQSSFHLLFIHHPVLWSTGTMTDDIIIVAHMDILTGEVMITGITLTGHISAGFITTSASIIPGNKVTKDITVETIADKMQSPLMNYFSSKGFLSLV